jgi:hypothetical protein
MVSMCERRGEEMVMAAARLPFNDSKIVLYSSLLSCRIKGWWESRKSDRLPDFDWTTPS